MRHQFKPGDPAIITTVTNPLLIENIGKVVTFVDWCDDDGDPKFDCVIEASDLLAVNRTSREVWPYSGLGRSHTSRLMRLFDDDNDFSDEVVDQRQLVMG